MIVSEMKIAIVHNFYRDPGGEDSVVDNEIELLRQNGSMIIGVIVINRMQMLIKLGLSWPGIFSEL